jgi:GH24 family phage-related lysozyme (muramidase)
MAISSRGRDFVVRHEGFVSRAYRCPAGEWTIGTGFTNRSSVAVQLLGRIKPGKTITRAENDRVLAEAFAREYGPPVDRAMAGARPHELDAGYSYCFNCGPDAMTDRWVGLWRAGMRFETGERLKRSRVTAGGKRLNGLVKRRAAEARLLLSGNYGSGTPAHDPSEEYRRKLSDLGYGTVLAFQKHHPHLVNDGIMGPATRAQIDRDIAARREGKGVGGAIGLAAGLAAWLAHNGHALGFLVLAALAGVGLLFFLRRREEVMHWIKDRIE